MNNNYAGFWLRVVALFIDGIIVSILQWIVIAPVLAAIGLGVASQAENPEMLTEAESVGLIATFIATMGLTILVLSVLNILYFSLMESSKYQGTVGKIALGIKVTDLNGNKVDFGKALVRNLCKILSSFAFCIGYIMAGFTEKKQGLHDMIASCLVVKKSATNEPI